MLRFIDQSEMFDTYNRDAQKGDSIWGLKRSYTMYEKPKLLSIREVNEMLCILCLCIYICVDPFAYGNKKWIHFMRISMYMPVYFIHVYTQMNIHTYISYSYTLKYTHIYISLYTGIHVHTLKYTHSCTHVWHEVYVCISGSTCLCVELSNLHLYY